MTDYVRGRYLISTDPARLDVDAIHRYIARSYWAPGRQRAIMERALRHSLCFGVYCDGEQVGLARVVTDYSVFAHLCDVYLLEEHRGQGLGKWLVEVVLGYPPLRAVRTWTLATRDAQELYRRYGFQEADAQYRMELRRPAPDES